MIDYYIVLRLIYLTLDQKVDFEAALDELKMFPKTSSGIGKEAFLLNLSDSFSRRLFNSFSNTSIAAAFASWH